MELNKKKSAILPFVHRYTQNVPFMEVKTEIEERKDGKQTKSRVWETKKKDVNGVPIVDKYKYRGTLFEFKLTEQSQLNSIKRKSNWIFTKLYPYLSHASADSRRVCG